MMSTKLFSTKRIAAIVLTLASLLCLQMGFIGLGSEVKEELDRMDDVVDHLMDSMDMGYLGLGDLDSLEDYLDYMDMDELEDDLDRMADEVEDCGDIILKGSYSLGDIRRICTLPDVMVDFMLSMAKIDDDMEDSVQDSIDDIKEEEGYIVLSGMSTAILIFSALITISALYNVVCYLLNRKRFTIFFVLLWVVDALAATFFFVIGASDGAFALQLGPILGLVLAIAARVVWGKEYKALAAAGVTMNQPLANVVGVVKSSAGNLPTAPKKAAAATFCTQCGETIPAGSQFCTKCGAKSE